MIKADLIHLSFNFWEDKVYDGDGKNAYLKQRYFSPELRFDKKLFHEVTRKMSDSRMNMVVIDLGDGVKYKSHPEIAVDGALSVAELKEELSRLRDLGLEPIPKMNFSSCHDVWLGEYSKMLSTPKYYEVCSDLIMEAAEIFDGPRFFHIGMDEETYEHQKEYEYVVVRQGQLWWDDLCRLFEDVKKTGARSWMWSDKIWHCGPEVFEKYVPKDVLQSNWYYYNKYELDPEQEPYFTYLKAFLQLDKMGYEQVPGASVWDNYENYPELVKFCKEHIQPEKLLGFMMTVWYSMVPEHSKIQFDAIEVVKNTHQEV